MKLFDKEYCIDICLKNSNKYVVLAVEDLQKDFERVSFFGVEPKFVTEETENCIIIEENLNNDDLISDESFSIKSENGKIRICANTYLGTMWGIYTLSESVLGIDPCYLWNDLEIAKTESLEVDDFEISETQKGFGFRGVFLNDEDLLTGWKESGGVRYFDYYYYNVTVATEVIDRVVETLLRLKLNLIIPASFLDIDNPPEKAIADCVAKRGIFLSQHHIEPVGVTGHTFERYCKRHGKTGTFSYGDNPELLEEVWKYYAEKWAEYDNVVWQIGLRGKGDNPIWYMEEPTDEILAKYGKFISDAIHRQKEIIAQATKGRAKYFTSTLWMEGSRLMQKGILKVPEETIIIFADNGPNQMYGMDFHNIARYENIDYGIYYHIQYFGDGPHLAPMTGIDKLYYNISAAYDKGDNVYSILNASNIREFVYELKAYSEMLWDFDGFDCAEYKTRYVEKFGDYADVAGALIEDYFNSVAVLDTSLLSKHFSERFNYNYEEKNENIKNFVMKDGFVRRFGMDILKGFKKQLNREMLFEIYSALKKAIPDYRRVCEGFKTLAETLDQPLKKHIEVKWLLYAETMRSIYEWYINLYEAKKYYDLEDTQEMINSLKAACGELETYLSYRKCAEYGEFENWYRGDMKMDMKQRLFDTKRLLGHTPDIC